MSMSLRPKPATATALHRTRDADSQFRLSLHLIWVLFAALMLVLSTPASGQGMPVSFADLAERVSPAVVNITTSTTVAANTRNGGPGLPEGTPFEEFFRDFLDRQQPGPEQRQRRSQALGSGFVISEDGFIVTNNHVIEGADEIRVEFFSGRELVAQLIGTDPLTDIALLKVNSSDPLPFVPWGDSEAARVGDWVIAVGNPLGQGFSVSSGIISAKGRALQGSYDDYIQTDAAINRGNSGGPLFNMDGEVIGVNTAILSPTGGSIGIGFAMSSAVATRVVEQLRDFGETRRGWLGVRIQDVTPEIAEAIGLERPRGALVTDVPEGPALTAGVQSGDVILAFDGKSVADTRDLVRRVGEAPEGRRVALSIFRDGDEVELAVVLGRREAAEGTARPAERPSEPSEAQILGLRLGVPTPEEREALGLAAGFEGLVVREVDETSEAFEKGLRAGDVITEAGQRPVTGLADFEARISEARDAGRRSVLLLVRRAGEPRFVAIGVGD